MSAPSPAPDPDITGAYRPDLPSPAAERFAPGELLAGRYRVVAPLGRGGMGEVYRADDLALGQPVALKFLPAHLAADPDRLTRFRKEVAAARRVSHPHVCRVYDIGEHAGQPFLAMEFVDGEDLASLLKRVGRVPEEKGLDVARQLCGALAAVHDQGLLHRDLKPANVMLDGRGRIRLTDFGLAAAATDLSLSQVRSGTPLYQAPEQLAGTGVTARSDVYALGLVLYELFTGRRAFADARRDTPPSNPTSHVTNLSPAVEAVILRCLEPDPASRPQSAAEVLAGLPGGDPLAAALAAGETPSPQMVADSGASGTISPRAGVALLAGALGLLAAAFALRPVVSLHAVLPPIADPASQDQTARRLLDQLGAPAGIDSAAGYRYDPVTDLEIRARAPGAGQFPHARSGRTHTFFYFHRRSPGPLADRDNIGTPLPDEPAANRPGMSGVKLDAAGRLLEYYRVPDAGGAAGSGRPADWGPLLAAVRPGDARVTPAAARWVPPVFADERLAWDVADVEGPSFHAEAAALAGVPVWFRLAHAQEEPVPGQVAVSRDSVWIALFVVICAGSAVLAGRNLYRGRGDVRGAVRLVAVYAAAHALNCLSTASVPAGPFALMEAATGLFGEIAVNGLAILLAYLSLEPVARRRWPWQLASWSRLLMGRARDPIVGRDILVGTLGGLVYVMLYDCKLLVVGSLVGAGQYADVTSRLPFAPGLPALTGDSAARAVAGCVELLALFLILVLGLRKAGVAWCAWVVLLTWQLMPATAPGPGHPAALAAWLAFTAANWAVQALIASRFGLLAMTTSIFAVYLTWGAPVTADPAAWYFWRGAGPVALLVALAGWAAYTATGGLRVFHRGFFGDD